MATVKEAQEAYNKVRGEYRDFLKAHTNTEGKFDGEGDSLKAFNDFNADLNAKNDALNAVLEVEKSIKANEARMEALEAPNRIGLFGGGEEARRHEAFHTKTLGQMFLDSPEYKANVGRSLSETGTWQAKFDDATVESSLKAALTTSTGVVPYAPQPAGIVPYATRRPVMRELLPQSSALGQLIQFIRQNTQTFGADIVAEGGSKPETTLGTERVTLTLEAIAHYIKVTNQALRFIPNIRDLIDQKGTLGILLAEEDKILNYNGSAGWKGFLQQTGVQSSPLGTQDQFTAFHTGMNLVQYTGFANVTGGVMNNNDWHKVVTTKDANDRFIYGDPFSVTQQPRLWGVPLIVTPVMTEGTVLIGDFQMDSRLWVDNGMTVLVGYVNDDLIKNQQTIVVEEYMALEIDRPASFVKMTGWEAIS